MKNKKTTSVVSSYDVARFAGVSQSAVSRTFTMGASVSDKMRRKVEAAAHELGYKPNSIARSLIKRSTNIIGLVISYLDNPIFTMVLDEFSRQFLEKGYNTLLFNFPDNDAIEAVMETAMQYRVDGIILTGANISSRLFQACIKIGTPVILYDRYSQNGNLDAVYCDGYDGSRRVAEYLIAGGHKKFALMAGTKDDEDPSTARDREQGFIDGLAAGGKDLAVFDRGDFTYASGRTAGARILSVADRPDALFCTNDLMAMGAMDLARQELGLHIPQDLSVVGFNDIPMAAWDQYQLTTIRQPIKQLVRVTISRLLESIADPVDDVMIRKIRGEIISRTSARKPHS
jgi:DNA-binding LacI/PurR family transcriptional regulator